MILEEKIIGVEDIYDGPIFKIKKYKVTLPDGKIAYRDELEHNGGACVLAYFEGFVYLVKQFRLAKRGETIEVPAGKLEKGEDPLVCAYREIEEETGLIAKDLKKILVVTPSPGYTNEDIHVYFATDLIKSKQKLDEDEFINVLKLTPKECFDLIDEGKITDSKTLAALLWLKGYLLDKKGA